MPLGETAEERAMVLARDWVRAGVPVEVEVSGRSLKAALKRADRERASAVAILGDDELAAGNVAVRDLTAGTQEHVAIGAVPEWWRRRG